MVTSRGNKRSTGRGFSLIELLVVMFIIGLVVAITIPALGFARTLAKKTSTQTFMNGLSQACTVFQNDNRRVPGYFSPREMGSDENRAIGFTAMDNVLLDLSGGVTTTLANGTTIFALGPTSSKVNVDPDRVGIPSSSGKIYWTPDAKYYETQVALGKVGDPLNLKLKSVIDAFGQPLLFWANDDASIAPLTAANPLSFARMTSGVNGSTPARFYAVSNSAYLGSGLLGKRGRDQAGLGVLPPTASDGEHARVLSAFLGNPSAIANPSDPQVSWVPSAGRGKFMIHSAGNDAVFLSREDNGYKKHGGGAMTYASNFVAGSTKPVDIASDFDDLLVSGGN